MCEKTDQSHAGGNRYLYTPSPRGECENCCEIKEIKDVKFYLYNEKFSRDGKQLFLNDAKRLKHLDKNLPLVIYTHGFTETANGPPKTSSHEMKDAFLQLGNYSVILVDWSSITALPWYSNTVESAPRVGRYLARFVKFLIKSGVLLENIHLIGFSLGAQVSGFAGKTLKEWGILLPRITGLDPAGPLFMNGDTETHISPGDAKFVDVIHTDSGLFGIQWPVGHADFFPNGGYALQPGCIDEELSKNNILGIIVGCSHSRAWQYFVESIYRPTAFECDRCEQTNNESKECNETIKAFMGLNADKSLRGKFFVKTNSEPPYGINYQV
ncbi:hypothetical protein PVAND_015198 [Polypedilum vanderplanki]|uniref:Lipase domain-containing protein n=1 Tax=Polypedilum vanderplanki TaxID=319348 RepID=A0A9J6BC24_POLVA|nr:hypothetical protein PVAND_015198 [Polypedilum vanderplanki]